MSRLSAPDSTSHGGPSKAAGQSPNPALRQPLILLLCPAFHGATLLSLLLNNHSQVSSLGDTLPARTYDQLCSCGLQVSECPFWIELSARIDAQRFADGDFLLPLAPRLSGAEAKNRSRSLVFSGLACAFGRSAWSLQKGAAREFLEAHEAFEREIRAMHGTRLVIDGKKDPYRALSWATLTRGRRPLKLIHLTRDPRGFRNSCRKYMKRSVEEDARDWVRQHKGIRRVMRVLFWADKLEVRYEDVCAAPQETVDRIFRFLGVAPEPVVGPPRDPAKHHLMGNRMLREFTGEVRLDTSWRERLSSEEQATTLRIARREARRYGYG